eukprot:4122678-Prymnesium_polylepis.1
MEYKFHQPCPRDKQEELIKKRDCARGCLLRSAGLQLGGARGERVFGWPSVDPCSEGTRNEAAAPASIAWCRSAVPCRTKACQVLHARPGPRKHPI